MEIDPRWMTTLTVWFSVISLLFVILFGLFFFVDPSMEMATRAGVASTWGGFSLMFTLIFFTARHG